jgi:DNA-binding GntR family transcriptional regulator
MVDNAARHSLATELFDTLKARILRWEYLPGHRFTEETLCKEFGVSRSPVREMMRMLEENGLVDKVPYRGCTVKQLNPQEISELYDVRLILEMAAIEQVVAHARLDAAQATELYATWQALARVTSYAEVDGASLADKDRAFHETLVGAAGNRTLLDMLRTINDRLHFIRMTDITTVERLWDTCRQHVQILDAVAAGDVNLARAAMRANIEGARSHVHSGIKEALARAYLAQMM